jgi:hypothetical protein
MLDLSQVTLVCFERQEPVKALALMAHMCSIANFGDVRWSNAHTSYEGYEHAEFEIFKTVRTSHIMTVHLDGFILNPDLWKPEWLNYDYIGAPWPQGHFKQPGWTNQVGNAGFCLRSRDLSERASALEWKCGAFDQLVSQAAREKLERERFSFASLKEAAQFSVEIPIPETPEKTFGFHGNWPGAGEPPPFYSPGQCALVCPIDS